MRYIVAVSKSPDLFTHLPVTVIADSESDNHDELVVVDPDEMLSRESRETLASIVAAAMNGFEPEYEDGGYECSECGALDHASSECPNPKRD